MRPGADRRDYSGGKAPRERTVATLQFGPAKRRDQPPACFDCRHLHPARPWAAQDGSRGSGWRHGTTRSAPGPSGRQFRRLAPHIGWIATRRGPGAAQDGAAVGGWTLGYPGNRGWYAPGAHEYASLAGAAARIGAGRRVAARMTMQGGGDPCRFAPRDQPRPATRGLFVSKSCLPVVPLNPCHARAGALFGTTKSGNNYEWRG